MRLSSFRPKVVPGSTGGTQPFFSADGKWIAFFAGGAMHKVAVAGGTPLRISEVSRGTRGGSWGANDTIVFALLQGGLWTVSASGGTPQPIPNTEFAVWPEVLPNGNTVLFTNGPEIATIALDGTSRRVIASNADVSDSARFVVGEGGFNGARYVPAGYVVYGQGLRVMALPFDARSQTVTGAPLVISESVFRASGGGTVFFSVSAAGVLAYAPAGRHELVMVSREGRATPISSDRDSFHMPRLSPDGRRLAVVIDTPARRSDIWVYDVDDGRKMRLTSERSSIMPVWTPDSARVTFGQGTIVERPADGSGTLRTVLSEPNNSYPTSWSRDARHLLINDLSPAAATGNGDIWVVTNGEARPLIRTTAVEVHGRFSPDGRWIAYQSNESGRHEVYAIRYPQLEGRVVVSAGGGAWPVWSRDGREIFYRQGFALMAAGFDTTRGLLTDRPSRLFEGPFVGAGGEAWFDVTSDGRFLMTRGDDAAVGRQINVVTNWFAELK
jgi:Tol biopolymer transport system component